MATEAVTVERSEEELRQGLFEQLDTRARELDRTWSEIWVEMADICITVDNNNLWREGGFHSFNDWLKNACPRSRSFCYLAIGARKELKDIPDEDLKQIPLGNAEILTKLPKRHRNGKRIIGDAKSHTPAEFLPKVIEEAPEALLEHKLTLSYKVSASQAKVIQDGINRYLEVEAEGENLSPGDCLEAIVEYWMQDHRQ